GLFIWRGTNGLNIDFTGGTAYTVRLKQPLDIDTVRDRVEKAEAGKQPLPDIAIEQIFGNAPGLTEGNKSGFYTIRTPEKDRQRVLQDINERLGNDLKRINLKVVGIAKDNKSADLEFSDPDTGKEEYASRAQVQNFLNDEFEKYKLGVKQFSLRGEGRETQ